MGYYSDCWTFPKEEIIKLIGNAKNEVLEEVEEVLEEVEEVSEEVENEKVISGNGYIKFADGTMIQYGEVENEGENGVNKIYFPQSFKNVEYVLTTGSAFNLTHQYADFRLIPQSAAVDYFFMNFKPYNGTGNYTSKALAYWIAIGKWK